ncbi:MAG: chemotaxis protein CheA [Defluviitaleaceae bacterium]|nr:chemotaxis protein CheA [Defluviitaleaceae bacterium]MCL2275970.1 chemotaxis protein CheA [Defluviitaleaceae bacterium]
MADFDREGMLDMFIFEMTQLVDQLETTIVQSESEYNINQINEIFRVMHTIKGSCAMMLYDNIAAVGHAIEDLFYYLREENPQGLDFARLSDHVLGSLDFVKAELGKISNGLPSDGEGSALIKDIEGFLKAIKTGTPLPPAGAAAPAPAPAPAPPPAAPVAAAPAPSAAPAAPAKTAPAKAKAKSEQEEGDLMYRYKAMIYFQEGCEMENIRAYTLVHNLQDLAQDVTHVPTDVIDEASIELIRNNGFEIEFVSELDYQRINNHLSQTVYLRELKLVELGTVVTEAKPPVEQAPLPIAAEVATVQATPAAAQDEAATAIEAPTAAPTAPAAAQDEASKKAAAAAAAVAAAPATTNLINVSVSKLDTLQNLMGELVISEAMVTQNAELQGLQLDNFHKETRHLRKIIGNLRQTIMSMRLVPLGNTFHKQNRIVRDMCRQLNKEVHLEIVGEDTEVDKKIIEHIADPIMHIIRNSIDHGVEMPDEREKKGKPRKAHVLLEAKNAGGDVLIIIQDDGKGINTEKVLAKAKENGLTTKPDNEYTEKEIQQFIFLPGFSTNDQVTNYSGRGVGMDVVFKNLEICGGTALVDSTPGVGTTFTLKIPLTLAIIEGMSVKVADAQYTIPIANIIKSFKADPDKLFTDPNGNEMITERDEVYNIVRLHEFFGIEGAITNIEDGTLMELENGDQRICLLVDELLGQQQAVVKPMPKYFKRVRGIGGCTLLGTGDVSIIVDVPGFFDN